MSQADKNRQRAATRHQLEASLPDDPDELRAMAAQLAVDNAVLHQELELVKKDVGVIPGQLTNRHKTVIIDKLRQHLPLQMLLERIGLDSSSYYYTRKVLTLPDKHVLLRLQIRTIAHDNAYTYGALRVWLRLRRTRVRVSEKVVRRLMKEEQVPVRSTKTRKQYCSYIGEISPAPPNHVNRNFHAAEPYTQMLTDVTEFATANGKLYLSPILDCFDGLVLAYKTSRHPDKDLATDTLRAAIDALPPARSQALKADPGAQPLVVHSDRGGLYRTAEWINLANDAGITLSMSRKGYSPDNAACEGFFGRMKNEMYHHRRWADVHELDQAVHDYIDFYNNKRIKNAYQGLSIAEQRTLTGIQ